MEARHEQWEGKRRFLKGTGEFHSISVFQLLIKVVTILDFLLVFLLLPDLFLTPSPEAAGLTAYRYGNKATLHFADGGYEEIKLERNFKETLNQESNINIFYSPVFHIRKYFEGIDSGSKHYREDISEYTLPVAVIVINIAAVFMLFVFPNVIDRDKRDKRRRKDPLALVKSAARPYLMLLPALVSVGYWLELLRFMLR